MRAAKTPENLKEMPYPLQKKLLKRKGNSITPANANAPISQTSSERLKMTTEKFTLHGVSFGGAECYISHHKP